MTSQRQRFALYARVSKGDDQTTENQLLQLKAWAQEARVDIVGVGEEAESSRDTRPKKLDIVSRMRLGTLDGVAFVSLSRWGRSLSELARDLEEAIERNWTLVSIKEGLRFDTAAGKMYAGILGVFAQFERDLVRERTLAGLARARAQGKVLGRPRKSPPAKQPPVAPGEPSNPENVRLIQGVVREAALATGLLGDKGAV